MDVKVSKEISRLADGLIKRTSSVLDEIDSKAVHEEEKGDQLEEKEVIWWVNKASWKHKQESAEFSRDKSCAKGNPFLV